MAKKRRVYQSQFQRGEIDDTAEREGEAVIRHHEDSDMGRRGRPRKKGVRELADEVRERKARKIVRPERSRNSFRETGI